VCKNTKGWLKICTSYLVYSQIWQSLAKDDCHLSNIKKSWKKKTRAGYMIWHASSRPMGCCHASITLPLWNEKWVTSNRKTERMMIIQGHISFIHAREPDSSGAPESRHVAAASCVCLVAVILVQLCRLVTQSGHRKGWYAACANGRPAC
jgi:hypothetical protein